MNSDKELHIAYGLAIILLVVGVVSYAAFSAKAPEQPVRLMFKGVGGKVFFDHKTHTAESGYGIACSECHHTLEEGDTNPQACGECHEPESDDEDMPSRPDAFHTKCIGCHEEIEAGPVKCESCHAR